MVGSEEVTISRIRISGVLNVGVLCRGVISEEGCLMRQIDVKALKPYWRLGMCECFSGRSVPKRGEHEEEDHFYARWIGFHHALGWLTAIKYRKQAPLLEEGEILLRLERRCDQKGRSGETKVFCIEAARGAVPDVAIEFLEWQRLQEVTASAIEEMDNHAD